MKKIFLVGCVGIVIIFVGIVLLGIFIFNHGINFITTNIPVVSEFVFDNAKTLFADYALEDISKLLTPLAEGANVENLQQIINNYFTELKNNSNIDFSNFMKFVDSVKGIVSDGSVTEQEILELNKLFK